MLQLFFLECLSFESHFASNLIISFFSRNLSRMEDNQSEKILNSESSDESDKETDSSIGPGISSNVPPLSVYDKRVQGI